MTDYRKVLLNAVSAGYFENIKTYKDFIERLHNLCHKKDIRKLSPSFWQVGECVIYYHDLPGVLSYFSFYGDYDEILAVIIHDNDRL